MHDLLTAQRSILPGFVKPTRQQHRQPYRVHPIAKALPSVLLGMLISFSAVLRTQAASPDTAPVTLTDTLAQIDAAANRHDLDAVMQFYDRSFSHSDGLTHTTLERALEALWERYPNLTYQTELTSWEAEGEGFVAETTTTITGTESMDNRSLAITATIASRQRIEDQKIVEQEILTEQSQITTGENPPTVEVNLPETVAIGQEFSFDAIVQEPLGDRLLLGTALEEPINANAYLGTTPIDLELLSAGGLFKVGRAPALPDDRWISAVVVRSDGITAITQRLRVTNHSSQSEP